MTRVIVRGLQVLHIRSDVHVVRGIETALRRVECGKPGRRLGGDIDFECGRKGSEVTDVFQEIGGQMLGLDQLIEQHLAARIRHDGASKKLVAAGGDNLRGAAVRDFHPDHIRISLHHHAVPPT